MDERSQGEIVLKFLTKFFLYQASISAAAMIILILLLCINQNAESWFLWSMSIWLVSMFGFLITYSLDE